MSCQLQDAMIQDTAGSNQSLSQLDADYGDIHKERRDSSGRHGGGGAAHTALTTLAD
jgi:hypothetical protein